MASVILSLILFAAPATYGSDDNEFIYALHLDGLVLSQSITVLEKNGEPFLPVSELATLLSLAIRYEGEGKASGYILDESRIFKLDALTGSIILNGKTSNFDRNLAIIQKDDVFVAASIIGSWFPINITDDKGQQIIKLESREKLPLQQLLERKTRFQNLKKTSLDEDPSFPNVTPPYRILAPPVVDFATSADLSGKHLRNLNHRQSLIASGDLAALNASMNLSNSNGVFDRADFTAGRTDAKGQLLGPLQATQFAIGAVQTPAFAGISKVSNPMYGFLVTNRPTTSPSQFSSHDIVGPLPQGWDVELYYNGIPIGYQTASRETTYKFSNLPLKIGLNDFRIVLHGPNGETRVERQQFLLDGLMVQPGKIQYTVGANKEVIREDRNSTGTFMMDFGLTKSMSGFVGELTVSDKMGRYTHYADAGLKGTLGSFFSTIDHIRSSDGGSATLLSLKGYSSGLYITAGQTFLDKFVSETFPVTANPVDSITSLKLEGSLPLQVRIPFGIESAVEHRRSGDTIPSLSGQISGEISKISISEQLTTRIEKNAVSTVGMTQVGTSLRNVSLRGQASYILSPKLSPSIMQFTATKDIGTSYQLSGQVVHDPVTGNWDFTAGLSKRMGAVGFMLNAGASTSGAYSISTQLSISAGLNPRTGGVITDAFPMSAYGGLELIAYVDKNGNGSYDNGEPVLEGVRFFLNGGMTQGATGKDGILLIKQLPTGIPLDISVAHETISEPFLVPMATGYRIEARPGVISTMGFRFLPSGEIDGVVQFKSNRGIVPVAGVHVSLVDKNGAVVATTMSEPSGYFLFKKVTGGVYVVRLSDGEAQRLDVHQENSIKIEMPVDGDMLSDNDIILYKNVAVPLSSEFKGSQAN
ncbi:MAG: SdrD B-like domain-containing protein [Deltaproteobacteria bacterium]